MATAAASDLKGERRTCLPYPMKVNITDLRKALMLDKCQTLVNHRIMGVAHRITGAEVSSIPG
eukprot:7361665-Prymnesium_polylepis.3